MVGVPTDLKLCKVLASTDQNYDHGHKSKHVCSCPGQLLTFTPA